MGKILVIAEKPQAGKDIARILGCTQSGRGYMEGDRYIVTWAIGHLIGLKTPNEHDPRYRQWNLEDLPFCFDIEDSLKVLPDTEGQYHTVKTLIHRPDVDSLINAGDAGREGYLIQSWIYRMAGNRKPVMVLWASSLTEEAIRTAFANLKEDRLFYNLLQEAEARAEGDYRLGMNYSRAFTLTKASPGTGLSYGRCQTILLNLIAERDREIRRFEPVPYYNLEAVYTKGFRGILISEKKKKINFRSLDDAKSVQSACTGISGIIKEYNAQDKSEKAPQLYNLSALQQDMGHRCGFTPDYTLQIAQKLYEEYKVLSYPRTDSRYLSMDVYREIKKHLLSCKFGPYGNFIDQVDLSQHRPDKSYYNDLKVTDHHALIPTINNNMEAAYKKMKEDEKTVFDAVVRRIIAIFMPPYRYQATDLVSDIAGHLFLSKGHTILDYGYKRVFREHQDKTRKINKELQILPQFTAGDAIRTEQIEMHSGKTRPPEKFTTGSIIQMMEREKIGTSATRAEIIKKLLNPKRQFVTLENGKYSATELGLSYVDVIPEELKNVSLTQHFEERLALIAEGKITREEFLQELDQDIRKNIEMLKKSSSKDTRLASTANSPGICPKCGAEILIGKKNYYCSDYKSGCDFIIWRVIAGKELTRTQVERLLDKGETTEIKGFVSKKGTGFSAKLVFDEDFKTVFQFSAKKEEQ